ncbi:hypothetical protein GCM10022221_66250 [Actinocorallia aurea]
MTTTETVSAPSLGAALRRLYFVRFAFAIAWAALLFTTTLTQHPQTP